MRPPRRILVALLVALLVAVGLAGCGSAAPPKDLVWATGRITADGAGRDVAAQWNQAHPRGPKVRVVALPADADNQRELMALELGAGIGDLDVLDLDAPWTAEFASKGWLVDLDGMRSELDRVSLPGPVDTATWDGTLWAAPFTTDAGLLYYRTDLVAAPPKSWAELVDVGNRQAAAHGIAAFVSDGAPGEGLVLQFLEYLWAAGGQLRVEGSDLHLDDAAATKALEFMSANYRGGSYAPGFDTMKLEDAREVFQAGQAVFMRSWPYAYRPMNGQDPASQVAGKVGIAPLPTFGGTGTVAALGGHNLAVNKFCSDVGDAKAFVEFAATSRPLQREIAQRYSMAPTLRAAYDDLAGDPLMSLLTRQVLPAGRSRPATPDWATISQEMQHEVLAAYTGKLAPADAVAAMRRYIEATVRR